MLFTSVELKFVPGPTETPQRNSPYKISKWMNETRNVYCCNNPRCFPGAPFSKQIRWGYKTKTDDDYIDDYKLNTYVITFPPFSCKNVMSLNLQLPWAMTVLKRSFHLGNIKRKKKKSKYPRVPCLPGIWRPQKCSTWTTVTQRLVPS